MPEAIMWTAISSIAVAIVATFPRCLKIVLDASKERKKRADELARRKHFDKHSKD